MKGVFQIQPTQIFGTWFHAHQLLLANVCSCVCIDSAPSGVVVYVVTLSRT